MTRTSQIIIAIIILLFVSGIAITDFSFHGSPEGFYLLKGANRKLFTLKDHLQLPEYERLIARIEFEALYDRWRSKEDAAKGVPYLKYSWHKKNGSGYLINFFPDGTKFLACFGRAVDEKNYPVKGLFPGGGLPGYHYENAELKTNETGIALFDGKEWHQQRQKTDETIFSASDPTLRLKPGQWEFLGSKVLFASQFRLALKSSHMAKLGPIDVRIDRYMIYHAGDRFFTLANRLINMGTDPLDYHYTCSNESLTRDVNSSADTESRSRKKLITLLPGRTEIIVQTIGIAAHNTETGSPCKPAVSLNPEELGYFLSR